MEVKKDITIIDGIASATIIRVAKLSSCAKRITPIFTPTLNPIFTSTYNLQKSSNQLFP